MNWHPDVPDINVKKPRELEKIEELPISVLNAMTPLELDEKIRDAADGLAKNYVKAASGKATVDECILFVSGALTQTGAALNGKAGAAMVGKSDKAAENACKQLFKDATGINEIEY